MRNIEHLLGVEFLHDLYNRYNHKINAYRFRHTMITWKDGVANAYAPQDEWDMLAEIVGDKFYHLDAFTLHGTCELYANKRTYYWKYINHLKKENLTQLSNQDLLHELINFESIVFGELYLLNFVQAECGLTAAVKRLLTEQLGAAAEETFAALIQTNTPTAFEQERQQQYRIVRKWRRAKKSGKYSERLARKDIEHHCERYAYLFCAYGENPKSLDEFMRDFQTLLDSNDSLPKPARNKTLLAPSARKKLKNLANPKLSILVPLLVQGGIFRDTNKALLGQSLRYRFAILDEIATRGLESRDSLNFYLLSEIHTLIKTGKRLDNETIASRKSNGITLIRSESAAVSEPAQTIHTEEVMRASARTLRGIPASRGESTGVCKIVIQKEDAAKVCEGDIMVAIGTDFNVLDAMHRASAVITEEGGILSHASVVCREMKKPCCIGVAHAATILSDGMRVRVDATRGAVHMLE